MKRMALLSVLLLLIAVPALAAQPTAESSRTTGDILGRVNICPQLGVDRVVVHIPGRSYVAYTAPDKSFEFNFVPPGTYDIAFESDGTRVGSLSGVVVTSKQQTNLGEVFVCIDADGDGYDATVDCNDSNPDIHPNAIEVCNNVDDNCNGLIDEDLPTQTYYRDADSDGYGNPADTKQACTTPIGYVPNNLDCYDSNSAARPDQTGFFFLDRGDGSHDYNCDDVETLGNTTIGSCTPIPGLPGSCKKVDGWAGGVPGCGGFGDSIMACQYNSSCVPVTMGSVQTCH